MTMPLNLPNVISLLRIASIPFLVILAHKGRETAFFYLFLGAAFSDVLDGFIARRFNLKTPWGSRLDSFADFLLYMATLYGIYLLKWNEFGEYRALAALFLVFFLLPDFFSLIRFGTVSHLHLYSWKIGGVLQFAFIIFLFVEGFNDSFFILVWVWTLLAFSENMIIQFLARKPLDNVKTFFWFWRQRQAGNI